MFKFFRKLDKQVFQSIQHDEYAEETLADARREFLVACDQMEHWEAAKTYRAKQIERLEKYVQENRNGNSTASPKHVAPSGQGSVWYTEPNVSLSADA